MAQWILKANGKIVPCQTCHHLTPAKLATSNETEVRKRAEFDAHIMQELGGSFMLPPETLGKPKYASNNPHDGDFYLESHTKMMSNPLHVFQLQI